ncbi:MAG: TPM domain-containing protein [Patescibacteria group bacterium]
MSVFAYTSPGVPTSYVSDFADVITEDVQSEIEIRLSAFATNSTGEIAVVTVESLDGDDIESYATNLFREWGIGDKNDDTGILLLIAPTERVVRIEVGYGYEGVVPDIRAAQIIRNDILPRFRDDDISGGVSAGVNSILLLIENPSAAPPLEEESVVSFDFESLAAVLWIGFILLTWLASALARSKSWYAGGIIGAVVGGLVWFFVPVWGYWMLIPLILIGLAFDFAVSTAYKESVSRGVSPPWWTGGTWSSGSGSSSGSSFGGFSGGSSGGGGASGSW